jgi:hypothetical protein
MNNRIILTDVDGVLTNWEGAFNDWMEGLGYQVQCNVSYDLERRFGVNWSETQDLLHRFHDSGALTQLLALRDAAVYVEKLHREHGIKFHCITSIGTAPHIQETRRINLHSVFGEHVFSDIVCLPVNADKRPALAQFADSGLFWVEDLPKNCELGISLGLKGILMDHTYNQDYNGTAIRVKNWKDIYDATE